MYINLSCYSSMLGFLSNSAGTESACNAGDLGSIPGLERSPGGGNTYPLQYPGLENSINHIVHGVAKSRTRLNDFHFTSLINVYRLVLASTEGFLKGFPAGSDGKESACKETWVQSLGEEDPLKEEMTTHSNILAWRILWTEEPGGL